MCHSRKYYEAYDDRYRQVHLENLRWFDTLPSPIVEDTIRTFGVPKSAKLLEIGCGEGRDARYLLSRGYDLLATDVSAAAIACCKADNPQWEDRFQELDCIRGVLDGKFDFIYAVAVIHMLVPDADRQGFYRFVREHLEDDGIALICSMGDGKMERKSDISTAFHLQERIHEPTGRTVQIASTSYRGISFETFERELDENGLKVFKQGITLVEPDYGKMMFAVVKGA